MIVLIIKNDCILKTTAGKILASRRNAKKVHTDIIDIGSSTSFVWSISRQRIRQIYLDETLDLSRGSWVEAQRPNFQN